MTALILSQRGLSWVEDSLRELGATIAPGRVLVVVTVASDAQRAEVLGWLESAADGLASEGRPDQDQRADLAAIRRDLARAAR